jgi:hypothetical protein
MGSKPTKMPSFKEDGAEDAGRHLSTKKGWAKPFFQPIDPALKC